MQLVLYLLLVLFLILLKLLMQGNSLLNSSVSGNLSFLMEDPTNDFPFLQILADLYKTESGVKTLAKGDIDVREWVSQSKDFPLALANNTDFYSVDVRFNSIPEPGTAKMLLGAGALLVGLGLGWCKIAGHVGRKGQ